jgi:hypothetical protein
LLTAADRRRGASIAFAVCALTLTPAVAGAQDAAWLRDRGPGIATSMLGSYVRRGELLVYPFVEWYVDPNLEYKPSELGYGLAVDHRGDYDATEGLLFLAYGITPNVAIEIEGAFIGAELEKSSSDTSAMPRDLAESGLGDVEAQVRWRFLEETAGRPEAFLLFETVFPLQKHRRLIGTRDWEHKLGVGVTRGFPWGTLTLRTSVEYSREEGKVDAGEYAVEYLRRLSTSLRIAVAVEGNQVDEVALITELQWKVLRNAYLKVNNALGLTANATDFAPEVGFMMSF